MWDAAAIHVLPEPLWECSVPQLCHEVGMGLEKPSGNRAAPGEGSPCPHTHPGPASSEAKPVFSSGDPCVKRRD